MRCKNVDKYWFENGYRYVVAEIYADTTPDPFPTDGTDIDELSANDKLAQGTIIYVISTGTVYMAQSDGTFVEQ